MLNRIFTDFFVLAGDYSFPVPLKCIAGILQPAGDELCVLYDRWDCAVFCESEEETSRQAGAGRAAARVSHHLYIRSDERL